MATYTELFTLRGSPSLDTLRGKITVAIAIKANLLSKATPNATQKAFSVAALQNPDTYTQQVVNYILSEYNTSATSAITGASDAEVQTAVNAAVDTLLGA